MQSPIPSLANGLALAFPELVYDYASGRLYDFTVTIGQTITLTRSEVIDLPFALGDEIHDCARELAAREAQSERAELASVRDWLNSQRSAKCWPGA